MPQKERIPQDVLNDILADSPEDVKVSPLSDDIGKIEYRGEYDIANTKSSAVGKHQFLWNLYGDKIKEVTGVANKQQFRKDPQAQEKFFNYYEQNEMEPAVERLKKYNNAGYSDTQLKKLYHFKGEGGAQQWLTDKEDDTTDNNIPIDKYVGKPEGVNQTVPADIAADINSDSEDAPQKKSPSGTGLATSSPNGQQDSSQIPGLNATDPVTGLPVMQSQQSDTKILPGPLPQTQPPVTTATPQAITQPWDNHPVAQLSDQPAQGVSVGVTGKADQPAIEPPPVDEKAKTADAANVIAKDVFENAPQSYGQSMASIPATQPGNPAHDLTDPHADPANTAQWGQHRLATLEKQHQEDLVSAVQHERDDAIVGDHKTIAQVNAEYFAKSKELSDAIDHTIALQQINKEVNQKKYTPQESQQQIAAIDSESKDKLSGINADLKATQKAIKDAQSGILLKIPQGEYSALLQKNKDLQIQQFTLQNQYNQQEQKIQNDTRYNPIQLGAEHAALSGDKQAQSDLAALNQGKPINPERQQVYNVKGDEILKIGAANIADEGVKNEVEQNIDQTGDRLFQNNKGFYIQKLANARLADENPLSSMILPTAPWTKEEVRDYGNKIGLSENAIKELQKYPSQIPKSASELQLFTKGILGNYDNIHEAGARLLAKAGGVPSQMVNSDFSPGWQDQRGFSSHLVGEIPSDQNSFHNVRGAIGQTISGIGGLVGLTGEVGAATKVFSEAGIATDAAAKLANMGVMSFNGYNDAYRNSLEVIGDKPEDEMKRQAYSVINGLITGAIFTINPKTALLAKAFKVGGKEEDVIVSQIEKSNGIGFLKTEEGQSALLNYTKQVLKENGTQVGLAATQKIAEDVSNAIVNPKAKQNIPEDIKNTAISTSLAMLIPSLMGARGHAKSQTPFNSAAMWEMGSKPDQYVAHIDQLQEQGAITPQQAKSSQESLLTMKNIVSNTPAQNDEGQQLSPNQVRDYAFKMMQEHVLQQQADQITKQATASNTQPDKVRLDNIKGRISELQKQRQEIYDNPATPTPPVVSKETTQDIADEMAKAHYDLEKNRKGKLSEYDQKQNDHIKNQPEHHINFNLNYYNDLLESGGYAPFAKKQIKKYQALKDRFDIAKQNEAPNAQGSVATDAKSAVQDYVTKKKQELTSYPEEHRPIYQNHIDRLESDPEGAITHELTYYEVKLEDEQGKPNPDPNEIAAIKSKIDELEPIAEKIKNNKKVENTDNNNIPLLSKDSNTSKTTENEKDNDGQIIRQEDGTSQRSTQEERTNTEIRGDKENGRVQGQEEGIAESADKEGKAGEKESPALPVSKKRRKLIIDEEESAKPQQEIPKTQQKEFAAWDQGTAEGQPKSTHEEIIKNTPNDQPIGGAESFNDFKERIHKAWDNLTGSAKDKTLLIAHSGVMKMIEAADKHGWDNDEALRKAYNEEKEPPVGEIVHHETPNGELLVTRHGESEDNADGLLRTKEAELTPKGKKQAKTLIADKIKDEGVVPSEIISSDLPRAAETADIVHGQFTEQETPKKEFNPPQPTKPVHDMTGDELDAYHKDLKQYNKDFEQSILGDNYKEFKSQQRIADNPIGLHSKEAEKAADKRVKEIFDGLSKEDQDALDGVTDQELDPNKFYEPEDVNDIRRAVQIVEGAQDENELGRDLRRYLVDLNNAPEDFSNMSWRQKTAFAAMKAAKRIIQERGWDGRKVTSVGLESAAELFPDKEDAEFMLSKYIKFFKKATDTQPQQKEIPTPQKSTTESKTAGEEEKLKETPQPNGAIATEDVESNKGDATNLRLKQIEDNLRQQRASQQLEGKKRDAAEKTKDIPTANKHNENWYKKQDRIDKLEEEKENLEKKLERDTKEESIKKAYNDYADKLEKKYEANKKKNEGVALSSILGISTKVGDHVADFLVARAIEGIRELGNIHIAIDRAIRLAKEKFGAEVKDLSKDDNETIKDHLLSLGQKNADIHSEPVLPIDHEEYAKDIMADIRNGNMPYGDAVKEIRDEKILNRQGKPVSDQVAENAKAKILNYIDWHNQNDLTSIKNATTRIERARLGLDEEMLTERKKFGETWDDALKKIEDTKGAVTKNLISELSKKPRPLTDVENAIMLHAQRTKLNELKEINANINKADGESSQIIKEENKTSKARVLDELQQIYDINKAVGTENARGLASRRMMIDEKYLLVNMIAEMRATANDGRPLSDEQQAHIEELNKKIEDKQKAFDDYIKQKNEEIIKLQRQLLAARQEKKERGTSGASGTKTNHNASALEKSYSKSKRVADKLRTWADRIEKSNKHPNDVRSGSIDAKTIADALRFVADNVEKGGELLDHIQKAFSKAKEDNPGINESDLEREINQAVIDAGVVPPSPEANSKIKTTQYMTGFFKDGKQDRKAMELNTAANRAKAEFDTELKQEQQKQLKGLAKGQNLFIRIQRFEKLTNPLTLGKLSAAAITRLGTDRAEDVVGAGWSKIFPALAKGAIGEGGGISGESIRETADAMAKGWTLGINDAAQIWSKKSGGKSDLEHFFGKEGELPPEALDMMGQLHSMIKAPIKRYAFEKSLSKRLRRNIANGVDVNDPLVQTSIITGAIKDGNRAIFMQDNAAADWWQKQIHNAERIDPKTGKTASNGKKAIATIAQWMVPFVKVPTNIVSETARGAYGLPYGVGQALHAIFIKGAENLSEDEKDIIFRNLKKGTIGLAAMSLGYFMPQNFGGYYQQLEKRKDEDAEALGMKVEGHKIPGWLIESPIFQLMQIGATIRRVKDKIVHGEENGIGEGIWAGAMGLTENVPMIGQPMRIFKALATPGERNYFVGELAKSTIDPAILTYIAKVTDPADERSMGAKMWSPENHRKSPKTIGEHIESGLPILRENLPSKNNEGLSEDQIREKQHSY